MSYVATLSGNFGSYTPTLGNVRVDVNGSTISSGIAAIANTGGTAFEVEVTLPDGFNGPYVFRDSTDATKYCVGSVSPIFDHTTDQVVLQAATQASIDAIEAGTNELQTDDVPGLIAALNNLSAAQAAEAVWDEAVADHEEVGSFGLLVSMLSSASVVAQAVWQYAVRTLTSSASQTANAASGAALAVTRGVTFTHTFTGSIPENWQRFIFTAKDEDCQRDADAIIQVLITNPGGDSDGALVLEGATATAGQASLEVDQPGGTVVLTIHDDATAQMLLRAGADYDVKMILDDSTSSVFESSTFSVEATATWTT